MRTYASKFAKLSAAVLVCVNEAMRVTVAGYYANSAAQPSMSLNYIYKTVPQIKLEIKCVAKPFLHGSMSTWLHLHMHGKVDLSRIVPVGLRLPSESCPW